MQAFGHGHVSIVVEYGDSRQYPGVTATTPPVQSELSGHLVHVAVGLYLNEYDPSGHGAHWLFTSTSPSRHPRNVSFSLPTTLL
jgi:hypothetical protein